FDHHDVHPHESPWSMLGPLVVLAVLSVVGGWVPVPHLVETVAGHHEEVPAPVVTFAFASALAVGGLGLAWWAWGPRPGEPGEIAASAGGLYELVRDKWRVDELYDAVVVRPVFALADFCARVVDPFVIDGTVNGAGWFAAATGGVVRRLQTGNVQHYA